MSLKKRFLSIALSIALCIMMAFSGVTTLADETFDSSKLDPSFDMYVRMTLELDLEKEITVDDLQKLESVDLMFDPGLQSLYGIQFATNITSLSLYGCSGVTEIPAGLLNNLTKLTSVDFSGTGITGIPDGLFGNFAQKTAEEFSVSFMDMTYSDTLYASIIKLIDVFENPDVLIYSFNPVNSAKLDGMKVSGGEVYDMGEMMYLLNKETGDIQAMPDMKFATMTLGEFFNLDFDGLFGLFGMDKEMLPTIVKSIKGGNGFLDPSITMPFDFSKLDSKYTSYNDLMEDLIAIIIKESKDEQFKILAYHSGDSLDTYLFKILKQAMAMGSDEEMGLPIDIDQYKSFVDFMIGMIGQINPDIKWSKDTLFAKCFSDLNKMSEDMGMMSLEGELPSAFADEDIFLPTDDEDELAGGPSLGDLLSGDGLSGILESLISGLEEYENGYSYIASVDNSAKALDLSLQYSGQYKWNFSALIDGKPATISADGKMALPDVQGVYKVVITASNDAVAPECEDVEFNNSCKYLVYVRVNGQEVALKDLTSLVKGVKASVDQGKKEIVLTIPDGVDVSKMKLSKLLDFGSLKIDAESDVLVTNGMQIKVWSADGKSFTMYTLKLKMPTVSTGEAPIMPAVAMVTVATLGVIASLKKRKDAKD